MFEAGFRPARIDGRFSNPLDVGPLDGFDAIGRFRNVESAVGKGAALPPD